MYTWVLVGIIVVVIYMFCNRRIEKYTIATIDTNNWSKLKDTVNNQYGSDAWQSIVNGNGDNKKLIAAGLLPDTGSVTQLNALYGGGTNDANNIIYCKTQKNNNPQTCMANTIGDCTLSASPLPGGSNNCSACAGSNKTLLNNCQIMNGVWVNLIQAGLTPGYGP